MVDTWSAWTRMTFLMLNALKWDKKWSSSIFRLSVGKLSYTRISELRDGSQKWMCESITSMLFSSERRPLIVYVLDKVIGWMPAVRLQRWYNINNYEQVTFWGETVKFVRPDSTLSNISSYYPYPVYMTTWVLMGVVLIWYGNTIPHSQPIFNILQKRSFKNKYLENCMALQTSNLSLYFNKLTES